MRLLAGVVIVLPPELSPGFRLGHRLGSAKLFAGTDGSEEVRDGFVILTATLARPKESPKPNNRRAGLAGSWIE